VRQGRLRNLRFLIVPVTIRDVRSAADRTWIQGVYGEYLQDLSSVSMNTGMFPVSGEFGEREDDLLSRWFADEGSYPLLILQNERPVGFALVARPPRTQRSQIDYRMAEFFIQPQSRRKGLGRLAAQLILRRFSGEWEISEFQSNTGAVAFWRAVVLELTSGRYRETRSNGEVRQYFRSEPRR
jgi:predicted acetyltransferase